MTPDDAARCRAIQDEADDARRVHLIHLLYADLDRAERIPRAVLYLHLGMLSGMVTRLLDTDPQ